MIDFDALDEAVARTVDEALFFGPFRPLPWYWRLYLWVRRRVRRLLGR